MALSRRPQRLVRRKRTRFKEELVWTVVKKPR